MTKFAEIKAAKVQDNYDLAHELWVKWHKERSLPPEVGLDREVFMHHIEKLEADIAALQRRVEWTTELPKIEGFYWWKRGQARDIVNVVCLRGKLMVDANEGEFIKLKKWARNDTEWAGPLDPPHEARG